MPSSGGFRRENTNMCSVRFDRANACYPAPPPLHQRLTDNQPEPEYVPVEVTSEAK